MARKRFGRNQKRKLREEAKRWKDAHDRDKHAARYAINRYNRVKDAIAKVAKNSALLEPEIIDDDYRHREYWNIIQILNPDIFAIGPNDFPYNETAERIRLEPCHIKAAIDNAGLHVMLKYNDIDVRCRYSWMATKDIFAHPEYHVEEIARVLAMEIKRLNKSIMREKNDLP